MNNPVARQEGIYIEQLQDEAILYDKANHHAHRLSKTVFTVWKNADGTRSVDELARFVPESHQAPVGRDIVLLAIDDLVRANLMSVSRSAVPEVLPSRRDLAKKLTLAGASVSLLPFVVSLVAPLPAMARSYTPQTYTQELTTATQDFVKYNGSKNQTAATNFRAGITDGSAGIQATLKGQTATAQTDFEKAESDFNEMLSALGLPLF